jgi:hypothetical protein
MFVPALASTVLHIVRAGSFVITGRPYVYALSDFSPVIGSKICHLQVLIVYTANTRTDLDYRLQFGSRLLYFHCLGSYFMQPYTQQVGSGDEDSELSSGGAWFDSRSAYLLS